MSQALDVPLGCLWICTVGIGSLAEATGNQKEAEAESLPQLPCHFLPVATRGNPWPKARVAPGRPKEWLGSAGGMSRQCEDLRTHCHWMPLDVIGSFGT